uniref:Uncharacterized protein n=1 Tax=Ananas comosus var. bracteatus TaxID=296719 RepID=A0A6V7PJT2_ANACO|nr:unnamed protein product [Ananas comosus var. bracteatus]
MKTILATETMDIPEGVTVKVNAKIVEVEGPRGKLTRNFKHLNLDFQLVEGGRKLKVDACSGPAAPWPRSERRSPTSRTSSRASPRATATRCASSTPTFPINASITNSNSSIEIRNFLGEKKVRKVDMLEGVTILALRKSRMSSSLMAMISSLSLAQLHSSTRNATEKGTISEDQ